MNAFDWIVLGLMGFSCACWLIWLYVTYDKDSMR
jgi:hypothetical protein